MLSDVLVPTLDLDDTADPMETTSPLCCPLESAAGDVDVLVPGHGSIGGADQVRARINQGRAYVHALRHVGVRGDRGSAHRPRMVTIGCPACMNGNSCTSPEEDSATGRRDRDPLAAQDHPAKFLTQHKRAPTLVESWPISACSH